MNITYNTEQLNAINAVDGQVIVNAGPGSGKTQIIAERVGRIINETDTEPSNILILTFTNAGVNAMKKRLVGMYGPDAYNIVVHTFHSFGSMVLAHYPEIIGLHDLDAATEVDILEVIREIIDELPQDNVLRRLGNNPYFDENKIKSLFATLKTEDISEQVLEKKILSHLAELPTKEGYFYKRKYKDFVAGDAKPAAIQDETDKMVQLLAAAKLLSDYNKKLISQKLYDYADMLVYVSNAFDKHEFILRRYQETFLYKIADEMQDSSGLQMKIINQLNSYWGENADVMLVGDNNQSLYGFQGANVQNIIDWEKQYPAIQKINLQVNYRSNQDIIDAAHRVIINNTDSNPIELTAGSKGKEGEVSINQFDTKYDELTWVVNQAKVHGSDLAIIYSKHKQITDLLEVLEYNDIPYQTKRRTNALNEPVVDCILKLMKYFSNPEKYDALLYEVLNYPFLPIEPKNVASLIHQKRINNAKYPEDTKSLRWFISGTKISDFVEEGSEYYSISSPYLFVKWLITKSGMVKYFDTDSFSLSIINTFVSFISNQCARNPKLSLKDLTKTIRSMQENTVPLFVDSVIAKNGVHIMSAHASKGLEFPNVIMMDCTKAWMPSRVASQDFKFPDNITLSGEKGSEETARRAFYVAMTRAEISLTMTFAIKDGDVDVIPCKFIHEVNDTIHPIEVNQDLVQKTVADKLKGGTDRSITINDEFIADALKDFQLSFSAMDLYQKCPLSFYYKHVLKVPTIEKEHLTYGNAMHYALEFYYRAMRSNKKSFGPISDVIDNFKSFMAKNEHHFTSANYTRYLERGIKVFDEYLKDFNPQPSSRVEQRISNCHIEGVPVKCFIDLMEFDTEVNVRLTDYKTGKFDKAKYAPATEDEIGGQHWRQGFFYFGSVLAQNLENWVPKSVTFDYLEHNKKVTVDMDSTGLDLIKRQIKQVNDSIKNQDFAHGCGEETCQFCNLNKQINL
jgi:DNA helicase-2/ATP-dependent DNA helicase PcrA